MSEQNLSKPEDSAFPHEQHSDDVEKPDDALTDGLRSLAVPAPADTFARFRRRAAVVQGTRMLFESQVIGFWVVLDALLRLLLGSHPASGKNTVSKGTVRKSAAQGEGV